MSSRYAKNQSRWQWKHKQKRRKGAFFPRYYCKMAYWIPKYSLNSGIVNVGVEKGGGGVLGGWMRNAVTVQIISNVCERWFAIVVNDAG